MGEDRSNYFLEMLEPRILLSGNGIPKPTPEPTNQSNISFIEINETELGEHVGVAIDAQR